MSSKNTKYTFSIALDGAGVFKELTTLPARYIMVEFRSTEGNALQVKEGTGTPPARAMEAGAQWISEAKNGGVIERASSPLFVAGDGNIDGSIIV